MRITRSLPAFLGLLGILISAPARAAFPLVSSATVAGAVTGSTIFRLAQNPSSGDLYAAGSILAGAGNADVWIGRYASSLGLLSTYTYDKAGFGDTAFGVAVDTATGDVFAAGYVSSATALSSRDIWLARFNSALVLQSSATVDGSASDRDEAASLRVSSGVVFVVGVSSAIGGKGYWLARYDTNFVLLSSANFYQNNAEVAEFLQTADATFVVGSRAPAFGVSNDTWIGKFDSNLVFVASAAFNGPSSQSDSLNGLTEDGSGGVYAVGFVYTGTLADQYIAHYDSNLVRVGSTTVNGPGNLNEAFNGAVRTSAGELLVAGSYGEVAGLGGLNIYVAEYDSNLTKLSSTVFTSAGNASDGAYAILAGANNDVYVAGWAANSGSQDMWLGRFSTNPAYGILPAGSFAGGNPTSTSIEWSWTDASVTETGYRVMSGAVNVSGDLAANTTSWLQTGLSTGTAYGPYFAQAFNSTATADSGTASLTTLAAVPSGLAASGVGLGAATISWAANGSPAGTVYALERSTGAGYGLRQSSTALSFVDSTLSPASTYFYRVKSLNGELAASVYSSTLTVVTPPVPVFPAPASIAPAAGAVGASVPAAVVGTGFDASAALSLERSAVDSGVWTATGSFTNARMLGTLTKLRDGRVLLAGGQIEGLVPGLAYADVFDPATGSWTPASPMLQGRNQFAAALLADGRVLVAGGTGPSGPFLKTAEIFDPGSGTWTAAASMANVRIGLQMALLADGRVLAAGGWDGAANPAGAEIYDPVADTWSAAGSMAAGRMFPTMTVLRNGKVLVTGDSGVAGSTAELYDPAGNSWAATGSMAEGRSEHQAVMLPDGRVLVSGGRYGGTMSNTADVYDPGTGLWTATSPMADARFEHALVSVNGVPLALGGYSATSALASTEIYDAALNAWRAGPTLLAVRYNSLAVVLDDGAVLVAGGRTGGAGAPNADTAEVLVMPATQIAATGVTVPDAQHVNGTFSLSGAATGYWDVVVREPGSRVGRLTGGFQTIATPDAPTAFAGAAQSTTSILWNWTDNASSETGFRVMSGAVNISGDLAANATSWLQTGLAVNTSSGAMFVRAFNQVGSADSSALTRYSLAAVPSGLAAAGVGVGAASISWGANGSPAGTVYELERSTGTAFGLRQSSTAPSFVDATLSAASTYYYRVRALNGDLSASAYASSITVVTLPVPIVPAPASLTPSVAATGANVPAAVVGTGFDASAALSLERPAVDSGVWTATGSFTQPRHSLSVTKLRDGRALLVGGLVEGSSGGRAEVDLFSLAAGTWTAAAPLNVGRFEHAVVLLADGRVLVTGGQAPDASVVATAEIYDPTSGVWTVVAPMSQVRKGHRMALLPDGRVLAAGGYSGAVALLTAEIYDPALNAWTAAASMSVVRAWPTLTPLANGKVLVAGGRDPTAKSASAQLYEYGSNTWTAAGAMSVGRSDHDSVVLPDGRVLIAGGLDVVGESSTGDVYDPAANAWTATGAMSAQRRNLSLVLVGGAPLAIGGESSSTDFASTDIYDAATNAWRAGPSLTGTRTVAAAVTLDDGRVLVAGGRRGLGGGTTLNTAERLDAATTAIAATGVTVPDAQHVNGTISLSGAATGYWDVVVRESGGRVGRLNGGFQVVTLPAGPSAFAGAAQTAASILWTWTDGASNETGYRVMSGAANLSGDLAANATSWLQSGLAANASYGPYFAQSFNGGGTTDGTTASRWTLAAVPASLAAAGVYQTSATISWSVNGNPAGTTFQLERSTGTGYGLLLSGAATSYFDGYLTPSATHFYRVRALNGEAVATAYASTLAVVALPAPGVPGSAGTPAGTALGLSSVTWSWVLASGATNHFLYRAADNSYLGSSSSGPFVQTALTPNTAYGLRAAGVNVGGTGPLSPSATVYTLAAAPAGASAASITSTTLTASWTLNGNPAATVAQLERSLDAVLYSTLTAAAVTSYADADLLGCTTYYYRVRNLNGDGLPTAYASFSGVTANTNPAPPSGLTAGADAGGTVSLAWGPSPTEGVTGYRLYWDAGTGTVSYGAPLAVLGSTETAYTTGVLTSSASYTFALRAAHRCGNIETTGALAMSGAATAPPPVRAAIKEPDSGKRIHGNRVTILGQLLTGTPSDVQQVAFQYKVAASSAWLDVPAANINHSNPDLVFPYFTHWNVTALAGGSYDLRAVAYDRDGVPDSAPPAVRVVIDSVNHDIDENDDNGKVKKNQTISNAVSNVIDTCGAGAEDPAVRLTIPAGIVNSATATVSVTANPAITTAAPAGQSLVGSAIKIDLSNGQTALNGTAEISLTYPDTVRFPSLLQIYYLNEATGQWSRDFNSTVDTASRTVTGRTPHFSTFAIMLGTAFAASLDAVQVYPVPYKPNGTNADEGRPFSHSDPNSGIIFAQLASASEIKIYTLTGRLVSSLENPSIAGTVRWDARNQDGRDVASGAYFAVITAPGQKTVVKKLVIIR